MSYLFFLSYLEVPEEKIHLVEYGLLAFLVLKALQFDVKDALYLYGLAMLITFGFGSIDEIIQYLLPNRVGDLRDVMLNGLSGLLGLALAFSLSEIKGKSPRR